MVEESPERIPLRRRLAELYRQTGRRREAIEEMDAIGDALLQTGDRLGAIKVIEAILALNPPNAMEYHTLLETLKKP